ncbi:acyl carrier protein [Clostridium sp.]|uniref:acyl carrier protein n=1 Tax=Clostridium sp. TaxID=1506 RepID=UPI002911EE0D|nr:acyl carrier protein [Clostridium sp.]MDU4847067.1 acyl carrier protein [Clostridium sp.]
MLFEEIREVVCEQLGIEKNEVSLETTFQDLQADSLDLFQIVIELEEKYNIQVEDVEGLKNVKDVVDYVEQKAK